MIRQEFITVEEAREQILVGLEELGAERVFLGEAAGRVLAEAVAAPWNLPRFAHSARDGYALRYADLQSSNADLQSSNTGSIDPASGSLEPENAAEVALALVGRSTAGNAPEFEVGAGQAARITTGAPLPGGADTVVMQEDCEFDDGAKIVRVQGARHHIQGQWVRQIGEDMAHGEQILGRGAALGAAEVGLLAGFGRTSVSVFRRPRVSIVSTGDELVDPGAAVGPAQIVNSNAYMLAALVREFGGEATVLPIAPDRGEAIRQAFEQAAATSDLVLSSGGVSVGDFDLTRQVLDELTGGMAFWKVRMKPGKPLAFGLLKASSVPSTTRTIGLIGLPGNPNACFVGFHQFVRPAMAVLQGRALTDYAGRAPLPERMRARLGQDVKTTPRRRVYLGGALLPGASTLDGLAPIDSTTGRGAPGEHDELPVFWPLENQESGNLRLFCQSNAFGIIEEGIGALKAGDEILVERL